MPVVKQRGQWRRVSQRDFFKRVPEFFAMSDIDNTDERRTPGIILNLKEFPIFMSEAADSRDTGSRLLRADTVAMAAIALTQAISGIQ